jgi:DNA-binding transcriptional LysR family regulator
MEFHQLRYVTAAAEDLSISRAAQRLHVTQPALSRQIAALEAELGVALFDRVKKRIVLTDAGRFFLPKARQIICDAETSAQQLREQFGDAPRTLRLGFLSVFLDDLVTPAMREFRQRHPKARVSLFELPPRAQLDRLRTHELDAAILGNIEEADRQFFAVRRLSRNKMAAVLPEDHRLAAKKTIKLAALARESFISLSDAVFPGRREFLRAICGAAGFEPQVVSEVDSLSLMIAGVASGDGVALMPEHAQKLPHSGCVFLKLPSPAPTADLLLVQPKGKPSVELATLAELIAERAQRMVE